MSSLEIINILLNSNALPATNRNRSRSDLESSILSIIADIRPSLSPLSAATLLPSDAAALWQMYGSSSDNAIHLQHKLNAAATDVTSKHPRYHSAASLSASHPAASLALTTMPEEPQLSLTNAEVHAMVNHRIAATTPFNAPLRCQCDPTKEIRDPQHPHVCVFVRKNSVFARHEFIVRALAACIRDAGGISTTKAPISLKRILAEGDIMPDLFVTIGMNRYMIDVSVTYPCADSYIHIASTQCAAAAKRENEKKSKYDRFADRNGYIFVPFVAESFGAFGESAARFIRDIAANANDSSMANYFKRRIAIAVQRGNALIHQEGRALVHQRL